MAEARPLAARRIVVTRASAQGAALMDRLRSLGALPVAAPAIRILAPEDPAPLRAAAADLGSYDWLVCTSANGARALLGARPREAAWPAALRVATVGNATARVFADAGFAVAFQPSAAVADVLARELPVMAGERLLWPRGDLAKLELAEALAARGATVEAPIAYRTVSDIGLLGIVDALRDGRVDAITFTSASTVRHVVEGLAAAGVRLERLAKDSRPLIVCIGPVSAAAAAECGLAVDGVADPHDDDGLVEALIRTFADRTAAA